MLDFPIHREELGEKYSFSDWSNEFDLRWDKLSSSYFQYERLQAYQEVNNPSYDCFITEGIEAARTKMIEAVKPDIPFYRELIQNAIPYTRLHSIERPISEYL